LSIVSSDIKFSNKVSNATTHPYLPVIAVPENILIRHIFKDNSLTPGRFLVLILAIDFLIIVLVLLLLSRVTSKNFVKPLKLLIEGARQISKGNYSARISLKSKNEFGKLRDAFNTMAAEIEKEKLLKEKS
jgi:nitrogen fixation/metabolism regulation signal transduction histidine kinase